MKHFAGMLTLLLCLFLLWGCGTVQGVPQVFPSPTTLRTQQARNTPATPFAATPASTRSATATPTATPDARVASPTAPFQPRLGDTVIQWDTAFHGVFQDVSSPQQHLHSYEDDMLSPAITVTVAYDIRSKRVYTITVTALDTAWPISSQRDLSLATSFLPAHAVLIGSSPLSTGLDEQWNAPSLQTQFARNYFLDNEGNYVQPTLCNIFYHYSQSGGTIDHATISLGTSYGV